MRSPVRAFEKPQQTQRTAESCKPVAACTGKLGFSLIELLVVIAIVALLAALLLPALSKAKEKARSVICMNNGHQIMLSVHLYAADFNERFPPNDDYGEKAWVGGDLAEMDGPTNIDYLINPEYAKLGPYVGNYHIYRCPSDESTWTDPSGQKLPRVRSYSMNAAVGSSGDLGLTSRLFLQFNQPGTYGYGTWRTYGKLTDMTLPSPASLWVMIDENLYSINDPFFVVMMKSNPTQMYNFPGSYHNFSGMLTYGDSHSEIHKWKDPYTRNPSHSQIGGGQIPDNPDILWLQTRTSALR